MDINTHLNNMHLLKLITILRRPRPTRVIAALTIRPTADNLPSLRSPTRTSRRLLLRSLQSGGTRSPPTFIAGVRVVCRGVFRRPRGGGPGLYSCVGVGRCLASSASPAVTVFWV